jgi:hypothetical protein
MASADSAKKVARAAKAGGGPTRSQKNVSWGYYGSLIAIAVVGIAAIGGSIRGRGSDGSAPYAADSKKTGELSKEVRDAVKKFGRESKETKAAVAALDDYQLNSHWHMAYAVWDCTQPKGKEWLPPVNGEADPDPRGIHAHADGLIHIHPFTTSASGKKAVMSEFFKATGLNVTSEEIKIPAKGASSDGLVPAAKARTLKTGTKCTDGKKGVIRVVRLNDQADTTPGVVGERPKDIRLKLNETVIFALAPADAKIPVPAATKALLNPSDVVSATPGAEIPVSIPAEAVADAEAATAGTPTTAKAAAGSATTAKAGSATTAKAGSATTAQATETTAKAADTTATTAKAADTTVKK